MKRQAFNMVEIVLALVIIVIGIIGIMALFPVGQEASRHASGINSATDASDQFLRLFSSKLKDRWAILGALPTENPMDTIDDSNVNWQTRDDNGVFRDMHGLSISYYDMNNNMAFDYTGDDRDYSGLFKLEQMTGANIKDFTAVLRVWHTPYVFPALSSVNHNSASRERSVRLHVEVSWPAEIPYDKRQSMTRNLVITRPSANPLDDFCGAFRIPEAGQMRYTYYGSSAGYKNAFWVYSPIEEEIFHSQSSQDASTTVDRNYAAGTIFSFYTRVQPDWNNANTYWKHYVGACPPLETVDATGNVRINPNASGSNSTFILVKPNGETINRWDLQGADLDSSGVYYQGPATRLEFRPIGQGNQNSFSVDEVSYNLHNGSEYVVTSSDMTVTVYNANVNPQGKAMGQWFFSLDAKTATVIEDGQRMRGANPNSFPYYDDPENGQYDGAYYVGNGNPYGIVTEIEPGRKWLVAFEDIPGNHSWVDWDYNDVVVSAELLVDDGVIHPSKGKYSVNGRLQADTGHADYRFTVAKPDGTIIHQGNAGSGYNGPAIAIWVRPQGSGDQTITVNETNVRWNNENMVVIGASVGNLNADVKKVGGKWVIDVSGNEVDFSIMN
jgi:hypothetical protein